MLSEALSIYRTHFAVLVVTCALALLPAGFLMAGAVVFGVAKLGTGGAAEARTQTQPAQEQQRKLAEKPPGAPAGGDLRVKQLGRKAVEGSTTFDPDFLRVTLPLAYTVLITVALLLAGLALAHAAVVPLVLGVAAGPTRAWAVVASRIHALVWTEICGVLLVALGSLFFLLPGIALAVGFAFTVPVTMSEGISGRAALGRSWSLMRGHWVPALGIFALIAGLTALAWAASMLSPPGPWRTAISTGIRLLTYPLPLVALVLLYQRARLQEGCAEVKVC